MYSRRQLSITTLGVRQAREPVIIQALDAEPANERLDVRVLRRRCTSTFGLNATSAASACSRRVVVVTLTDHRRVVSFPGQSTAPSRLLRQGAVMRKSKFSETQIVEILKD
jgi:hypothetical protein